MFIEYATAEDLAKYLGIPVEELPKGHNILLQRASELIGIAMRNNFKPSNENHVEAAKLATCAQCQNWIENDLSPVSNSHVASYSLGELSITYSDVDRFSNKLSVSAARYLNHQHLLYKGMR